MTIHNMDAFMDGVWDWGFLEDSFPGKIRPTDVDGMVEIGGYLLILEAKSPGVPMNTGQKICAVNHARMGSTTIVMWGDKGDEVLDEVWVYRPANPLEPEKAYNVNKGTVAEIAKAWADEVRRLPKNWVMRPLRRA